tara:strand:+ start:451 stop:717 length:267 start_codon:yes stop_codon:yes gene_type:complete
MDKEETQLWQQEIDWRNQEIQRLDSQLFKANKHIVDKTTPSDITFGLWMGALLMFISWIPAWGYGRNTWQQLLYWINNLIWSNKDWWY